MRDGILVTNVVKGTVRFIPTDDSGPGYVVVTDDAHVSSIAGDNRLVADLNPHCPGDLVYLDGRRHLVVWATDGRLGLLVSGPPPSPLVFHRGGYRIEFEVGP